MSVDDGGCGAVPDRRPSSLIGSESSIELSFPGTEVRENESSWEQKFSRANVLCLKLSLPGAKVHVNEKSLIPEIPLNYP